MRHFCDGLSTLLTFFNKCSIFKRNGKVCPYYAVRALCIFCFWRCLFHRYLLLHCKHQIFKITHRRLNLRYMRMVNKVTFKLNRESKNKYTWRKIIELTTIVKIPRACVHLVSDIQYVSINYTPLQKTIKTIKNQ